MACGAAWVDESGTKTRARIAKGHTKGQADCTGSKVECFTVSSFLKRACFLSGQRSKAEPLAGALALIVSAAKHLAQFDPCHSPSGWQIWVSTSAAPQAAHIAYN